jgi:uncharacterized membrane protein
MSPGAEVRRAAPSNSPEAEPIEGPIPASLNEILQAEGVNVDDPQVSRAIEISLQLTGGPLPLIPPDFLREYGEVDPELPSRIIKWTETQSAHRRALEKQRAERSERRLDRGQYIAGGVALGGLLIAGVTGIFGSPFASVAIAILAVGGPTAAIALTRIWPPSK